MGAGQCSWTNYLNLKISHHGFGIEEAHNLGYRTT